MSDLKTLRGLSGLSPEPARLKNAALVLIDIQNTYRDGVMRLSGVEPAIAEARILLARESETIGPLSNLRLDAGLEAVPPRRNSGPLFGILREEK